MKIMIMIIFINKMFQIQIFISMIKHNKNDIVLIILKIILLKNIKLLLKKNLMKKIKKILNNIIFIKILILKKLIIHIQIKTIINLKLLI